MWRPCRRSQKYAVPAACRSGPKTTLPQQHAGAGAGGARARTAVLAIGGGVVVQHDRLQAREQAGALARELARQRAALLRRQRLADRLARPPRQPAPQQHVRLHLVQALRARALRSLTLPYGNDLGAAGEQQRPWYATRSGRAAAAASGPASTAAAPARALDPTPHVSERSGSALGMVRGACAPAQCRRPHAQSARNVRRVLTVPEQLTRVPAAPAPHLTCPAQAGTGRSSPGACSARRTPRAAPPTACCTTPMRGQCTRLQRQGRRGHYKAAPAAARSGGCRARAAAPSSAGGAPAGSWPPARRRAAAALSPASACPWRARAAAQARRATPPTAPARPRQRGVSALPAGRGSQPAEGLRRPGRPWPAGAPREGACGQPVGMQLRQQSAHDSSLGGCTPARSYDSSPH